MGLLRSTALVAVVAGTATAGGASAADAQGPAGDAQYRCPTGAFCIYGEGGNPSSIVFGPGVRHVAPHVGEHRVVNHLPAGWTATLCTVFDGCLDLPRGSGTSVDLSGGGTLTIRQG